MTRQKFEMFRLASLLVIFTFVLGCPGVNDMTQTLTTNVASEDANFRAVSEAVKVRGDVVGSTLADWRDSLAGLSVTLKNMQSKLSEKPEEFENNKPKLLELKDKLNTLFTRSIDLELRVPSWQEESARRNVKVINDTLTELKDNYKRVYAEEAPRFAAFKLEVKLDDDILDTRQDCINKFKLALGDGTVKDLSRCVEAAEQNCTHQIDLSCLDTKIEAQTDSWRQLKGTLNGICTQVSEDPFEKGKNRATTASWMGDKIRACQSKTPVFKPGVKQ